MARIERGNVVLHVEDYEVQRYLTMGYNLTDEAGNVIQASVPTSLNDLQAEYVKNTAKIEELEKQVAKLTAENQELKAMRATPVKSEVVKPESVKKAPTKKK